VLSAIVVSALCFCVGSAASGEKWLAYEPAVVELKGKLTIVPKYGPPNYGENPETDEKVKVPILKLSQPVNVRADPKRDLDAYNESFNGVREVQLVFLTDTIRYGHLIGKQLVAKGTLFQAQTGHHYTKVLMTVSEIRELEKKPGEAQR